MGAVPINRQPPKVKAKTPPSANKNARKKVGVKTKAK
jgi:hypothetical protein